LGRLELNAKQGEGKTSILVGEKTETALISLEKTFDFSCCRKHLWNVFLHSYW